MAKKNVLSLTIGPPIEPETWFSSSGMSAGLIAVSVAGVMQRRDRRRAEARRSRTSSPASRRDGPCRAPSPCTSFVPDLVTMFSAGPAVQPNSAENAFESTGISWTAPTGTVASIVWRPQPSSLLAPSSMNVVVRRLPAPVMK